VPDRALGRREPDPEATALNAVPFCSGTTSGRPLVSEVPPGRTTSSGSWRNAVGGRIRFRLIWDSSFAAPVRKFAVPGAAVNTVAASLTT